MNNTLVEEQKKKNKKRNRLWITIPDCDVVGLDELALKTSISRNELAKTSIRAYLVTQKEEGVLTDYSPPG